MPSQPSLQESVEFAENPEPRCACVLLLDTSASMMGAPIAALNAGVRAFYEHLIKDPVASRRVEVAVVSFNSTVEVIEDFTTVENFTPPVLEADGYTFMGSAINKALNMLQERKTLYRANGIVYYRPWVLMISDGEPLEEPEYVIEEATRRLKDDELNRRVGFFAVGVRNANMDKLAQIVVRPPVKLHGLDFTQMFVWLSASMQRVSQSKIDDQPIPPVAGAVDEQVPLPSATPSAGA